MNSAQKRRAARQLRRQQAAEPRTYLQDLEEFGASTAAELQAMRATSAVGQAAGPATMLPKATVDVMFSVTVMRQMTPPTERPFKVHIETFTLYGDAGNVLREAGSDTAAFQTMDEARTHARKFVRLYSTDPAGDARHGVTR